MSNTRATVDDKLVRLDDQRDPVAPNRLLSEVRVSLPHCLPRIDVSYSREQHGAFRWLLFTIWLPFGGWMIVGVVLMCKEQSVFGVFAVRRVGRRWIMQGSVSEEILN